MAEKKEMTTEFFNAYALAGELDLTRLATAMGLRVKYRWEEPMILEAATLKPTLRGRGQGECCCYLYHFGATVFVNCSGEQIRRFFARMVQWSELFRSFSDMHSEGYSLEIDPRRQLSITNDYALMPDYEPDFIDCICFVIAKSVALERIEEQVDQVLDRMEEIISLLDRGKLSISDRRLAKLASSILNFKYRSISHIMVLDKPDIAWDKPDVDRLYLTMAQLFELEQRYQEIRTKSETLMDITEVFTSLSHARRATRLEWIIIILIGIEIVIYTVDILWKVH